MTPKMSFFLHKFTLGDKKALGFEAAMTFFGFLLWKSLLSKSPAKVLMWLHFLYITLHFLWLNAGWVDLPPHLLSSSSSSFWRSPSEILKFFLQSNPLSRWVTRLESLKHPRLLRHLFEKVSLPLRIKQENGNCEEKKPDKNQSWESSWYLFLEHLIPSKRETTVHPHRRKEEMLSSAKKEEVTSLSEQTVTSESFRQKELEKQLRQEHGQVFQYKSQNGRRRPQEGVKLNARSISSLISFFVSCFLVLVRREDISSWVFRTKVIGTKSCRIRGNTSLKTKPRNVMSFKPSHVFAVSRKYLLILFFMPFLEKEEKIQTTVSKDAKKTRKALVFLECHEIRRQNKEKTRSVVKDTQEWDEGMKLPLPWISREKGSHRSLFATKKSEKMLLRRNQDSWH